MVVRPLSNSRGARHPLLASAVSSQSIDRASKLCMAAVAYYTNVANSSSSRYPIRSIRLINETESLAILGRGCTFQSAE